MQTVKAKGCLAKSQIFFGVLFLLFGILHFGIRVAAFEQSKDVAASLSKSLWTYWYYGYPVLIGLWTLITAGVGICTSNETQPRNRPTENTCKNWLFLQFSFILVGCLGYFSFDFAFYFMKSYNNTNSKGCEVINNKMTTNCDVRMILEGCGLAIGAVIVLLSLCCILCCCWSICCKTHETVEPDQRTGNEVPSARPPEIPNTSTTVPAPTWIDRPVIPPINTQPTPIVPSAPVNDNFAYNPNWPNVASGAGLHHRDPISPPPYSRFPENSVGSVLIDRGTSQAYFIRTGHRGYLTPLD